LMMLYTILNPKKVGRPARVVADKRSVSNGTTSLRRCPVEMPRRARTRQVGQSCGWWLG
jgi:hypothetical protein